MIVTKSMNLESLISASSASGTRQSATHGALQLILPALLTVGSIYGQHAPPPQQLVFHPYDASGMYELRDTVGWIVSPGPAGPTYAYKWTIRRNNSVVLKQGKLDLSSGKDKIEIVGDQPEMIYVAIEPYGNLSGNMTPGDQSAAPASDSTQTGAPAFVGGNTGRNNGLYAVGVVAPSKIGLSSPRPEDFDAFWDSKLAAQQDSDQPDGDSGSIRHPRR